MLFARSLAITMSSTESDDPRTAHVESASGLGSDHPLFASPLPSLWVEDSCRGGVRSDSG